MTSPGKVGSGQVRLANLASAALASSLVLIALWILALIGMADWSILLRDHPTGFLVGALLIGCYIAAFACLYQIKNGTTKSGELLWSISLLAASAPLVAIVYWLGPGLGMAVCFFEAIAVVIHIIALADLLDEKNAV